LAGEKTQAVTASTAGKADFGCFGLGRCGVLLVTAGTPPAGPGAEEVRREIQEDPQRDDHPAEAVDAFVRLVHQHIEERRVGQEDEAEDALPAGAEGNGKPIREDPDQEQREARRER
jgi:hypothetical protein